LLYHGGGNPAKRDAPADRPWRHNQELATKIRKDWRQGKPSSEATTALLASLRDGSSDEVCGKVVSQLNGGIDPGVMPPMSA
jgi:hypothetical protein